MKKTLLAAALAVGFAGVAQAETSVTLYGIIDAGISYERQKGTGVVIDDTGAVTTSDYKRTRTGLHDGTNAGQAGSRWGLKGVEDLGSGLRAVFQLESGFDTTTGRSAQGGRLFGRQATIGLHSDSWGQIDVGRQTNVGSKYMLGAIDPFGGGFGMASAGKALTATDTVRYDNTIIYQTPNFSGFQFGVGYSFNTDGAQEWKYSGSDDTNIRAITTGLRYANGPIAAVLTYDQKKNSSNVGNMDTTAKQWNLGLAYDFEVVKVSAAFGQTRNGRFGGLQGDYAVGLTTAAQTIVDAGGVLPPGLVAALAANNLGLNEFDKGFKANAYVVGLSAPIGAGTVMASWNMTDPRSNPDRIGSADWDMKKQQAVNLGYKYSLSKRTGVYAYGSYTKNVDFIDGQKSTVVGAGLMHQF